MKLSVLACDICGSEFREHLGITIRQVIGRSPDPSGNGYVEETKDVDVCGDCCRKAVLEWQPVVKMFEAAKR